MAALGGSSHWIRYTEVLGSFCCTLQRAHNCSLLAVLCILAAWKGTLVWWNPCSMSIRANRANRASCYWVTALGTSALSSVGISEVYTVLLGCVGRLQYQFCTSSDLVHFSIYPKILTCTLQDLQNNIVLKDLQDQCVIQSVSNTFYLIRAADWNGCLSYIFHPNYNFLTCPCFDGNPVKAGVHSVK